MLDLKQESVINKPGEAGLYLSNKLLTDLEVLNLTRDLQTAEKKVDELDLSYNNLKDRSGVFIGNLIASGYKLKKLKLTGCSIEKDGVQRIFESLHTNSPLKEIDIGLITDFGLNIIAKYVPRSEKLKRLAFQGSSPCAWSEAAKRSVVDSLTQVYTLLDVQITCEGHQDFIEEIQAICDRNKNLHAQKKEDKRTEERQDPKMFAEHLQKYIENSIQNLPVRVYIENALGTLLNDGLYELAKHRNKESDVSHNTATNNIKWLIRYIIDHHFPKQPNN